MRPVPTPNNMGGVRYILAISVLLAHFKELAGADFFFPVSSYTGVGGFFALSGFLIYGSYHRVGNLRAYIRQRAVRILPAYWTTVVLFAILFFFVSTLSFGDYFCSAHFWKYMAANLAFLNFVEPTLPLGETHLAIEAVNGSLWTMKVEWLLYLSVPVVAYVVARLRDRLVWVCAVVVLLSMGYRILLLELYGMTGRELYLVFERQVFGQLAYFYLGVLAYYCFDLFMRFKMQLIIFAAILVALAPYLPYYPVVFHPVAVTIVVIWLSMVGRWWVWEGRRDNVSYNMYLVHFPVIQIALYLGLEERMGKGVLLVMCLLAIFAVSVAMNRFIEKPVRTWMRRRNP